MAFIDTLDCYTAAVNAPVTSSENEFATSVTARSTSIEARIIFHP